MWTLSQTAPSLPVACRIVGDRKLGGACMGMRLLRLYLVCSRVPYIALFPDLLKVKLFDHLQRREGLGNF